jgi:hypothetical protein
MQTITAAIVEVAALGLGMFLLMAWIDHLKATSFTAPKRPRPQFERRRGSQD